LLNALAGRAAINQANFADGENFSGRLSGFVAITFALPSQWRANERWPQSGRYDSVEFGADCHVLRRTSLVLSKACMLVHRFSDVGDISDSTAAITRAAGASFYCAAT
jgi:hypothetical protein